MSFINILIYQDRIQMRRNADGQNQIYCVIRKRYFILTPEEHVRQLILLYLINSMGYSISTINVEKTIRINQLSKRPDILVFDKKGNPYLVIECKAPHIKLDEKTIQQVGFYNSALKCPYAMITNGQENYNLKILNNKIDVTQKIPPPPQ